MIITSRRQRRALTEIVRALRSSDPRLVARFTMFTRLTEDEQMPPLERMGPWPLRLAGSVLRLAGSVPRRAACVLRLAGSVPRRAGSVPRRAGSVFGRGPRGRQTARRRAGRTDGRRGGISRRLGAIVFIPACAAVLISVPFILGHGRAAAACTPAAAVHVHVRQPPFSLPGWTAPSCHRAGTGHRPAGRRLRATR
jgi:hypothetical protein